MAISRKTIKPLSLPCKVWELPGADFSAEHASGQLVPTGENKFLTSRAFSPSSCAQKTSPAKIRYYYYSFNKVCTTLYKRQSSATKVSLVEPQACSVIEASIPLPKPMTRAPYPRQVAKAPLRSQHIGQTKTSTPHGHTDKNM